MPVTGSAATRKRPRTTAAADADAVGDKLVSGGTWARDEVAQGFDSLGRGLDDLGRAVGVRSKARPAPVGG